MMKKIILAGAMAMFTLPAFAEKLIINVENIETDKGVIKLAIFDRVNADNFRKGEYKVAGGTKQAKVGVVKFEYDLPKGEYAAVAYHDINGDGELNKVPIVGLPTEPYGFSNDARGAFGPASFNEAMFEIDKDTVEISFDVQ
ncbi:MAG: DUF2141 domain-containing protein [Alphaproteobacteria bacterium]